jgi:hypothetical protein
MSYGYETFNVYKYVSLNITWHAIIHPSIAHFVFYFGLDNIHSTKSQEQRTVNIFFVI